MRNVQIALCVLIVSTALAQSKTEERLIGLSVGMGVDAYSAPSIVDYVNALNQPSIDDRLEEFSSAVEFFIFPEIEIVDLWSIGLEYSILLKSYEMRGQAGIPHASYGHTVHMGNVVLQYLIPGEGYWVKVGGGVGYHVGELTESYPSRDQSRSLQSTGGGMKVSVVGNTEFDKHFYGSIGIDLRWVFGGSYRDGEGKKPVYAGLTPRMSFFAVGLKLGVMLRW